MCVHLIQNKNEFNLPHKFSSALLPNRYYKSDQDVINDEEIQALVNELSAEANGSVDSGKGKVTSQLLPQLLFSPLQISKYKSINLSATLDGLEKFSILWC